jgi:predicted adenylyl cyclase CyaB
LRVTFLFCHSSNISRRRREKKSMKRNVEIKAHAPKVLRLLELAGGIAGRGSGRRLQQTDTFYSSLVQPGERLKLRVEERNGDVSGELIWYARPDSDGPKLSQYEKTHISDPEAMDRILRRSYGILGVVKKDRMLYLVGQTRIHVDRVENLGTFVELEVVLEEHQTEADGKRIAADLMRQLEITDADLVECAYMDLLLAKARSGAK